MTVFRRDIEGLRAIAVALVLLFHADVALFGGGFVGVDVFFVLSGFLITGHLLNELKETNSIRIGTFYAKRARRLLPASFVVLATIAAVIFLTPRLLPGLIAPQLYGRAISWDIQRSALYIVNWLFAERAVDYHGTSELASPVQHFWSLSIEEQFYAAWPVILLLGWKLGRGSRRVVFAILLAVTLASFAHSLRLTEANPQQAYFVTTTRVWELSLGGLGAMAMPRIHSALRSASQQSVRIGSLAVVSGMTMIVLSAIGFGSSTPWPGTSALVPTLGTLAVLVGAPMCPNSRPVQMLSTASLQWMGARSYSLYLWHWPILWLTASLVGPPNTWVKLVAVAFSFVPAALSYRLVEQPVRHTGLLQSSARVIVLAAAVTIAGFGLGAALLFTTTGDSAEVTQSNGIAVEVAGVQLHSDSLQDTIFDVRHDVLDNSYVGNCVTDQFAEVVWDPCVLGDPSSETTVLVLGNSHAWQWMPAVEMVSEANGWQVVADIRNTCRLPEEIAGHELCAEWARTTMEELPNAIETHGVDLVLMMPKSLRIAGLTEAEAEPAYRTFFDQMASGEVPVAVIAPTPHGQIVGVDCPSLLVGTLGDCSMDRELALAGSSVITEAASNAGVEVLDLTPFLCNDDECPAVIDDLFVRGDRTHLTTTFVEVLADPLEDELRVSFPQLFGR